MSIQALLQAKLSGPAIARQLTLSRSTINREINRSKATPTALAGAYQAGPAQVRSRARRAAAGAQRRKLGPDTATPLWQTVLSQGPLRRAVAARPAVPHRRAGHAPEDDRAGLGRGRDRPGAQPVLQLPDGVVRRHLQPQEARGT